MSTTRSSSDPTETILDPDRQVHLGIWRDEVSEISSRFFTWTVPKLTAVQQRSIAVGSAPGGPATTLDRAPDLLEPGYLPVETGIARGDDGSLCVAVWTPFPGAQPAMFDWWMGWHLTSTDRYKLWHPQAHAFAQPRFDFSLVEDTSDRQRYRGNTSWVDEYIGPFLVRLAITFLDPTELGLGTADADDGRPYPTFVVGEVRDSDNGNQLSHLVHHLRPTAFGSEMRSRFYFPPGTPDGVGGAMLDHCATEMAHLATFLPRLFATVMGSGPNGPIGL